ncbi:MAG: YeeE/YedE thiosulfate transporter family protein [Candidatus Devosia phytovorans]|uniref:YeeE/YedE thiosulfate transporter family protein n=1 Tax=Candidatus Devosia phytovorans TaxID=3121372 RepID=A0AAJ5VTA3_9HYPH|nr:YeeE/YedE thiosulfate transporter family protein [Devosia sp.]WEK02959.1 MAG: YeeE/YedE thiosulfate transporter family protein [Devosia sp.]
MTPPAIRFGIPLLIAIGLIWGFLALNSGGPEGRPLAFSLAIGAAFGAVLQRGRFCFYCNFRDLIEKREASGVIAILVALAVGAIGYTIIFGAWLPTPAPGRLPPTAHIGPVSVTLVIAALAFGVGMVISGSCLSAHFYRLAEGSVISPFAIVGAGLGFGLGFLTWNPLFLAVTSNAFILWLPNVLDYAGALLVTLALLIGLGILTLWWSRPIQPQTAEPLTLREAGQAIFIRRWPGVLAGIAVGVISTFAYFRVAPLGVTAELGSIVRTAGMQWSLLPGTLFGLDGLRGCATVIKEALLSNNGLFVIGLIGASFIASLIAGQFKPRRLTGLDVARGLGGGLLLGWGAMTALGCTVGVLLSGIHAGSLSGWIFLFAMSLGILATLWLGRRLRSRFAAA